MQEMVLSRLLEDISCCSDRLFLGRVDIKRNVYDIFWEGFPLGYYFLLGHVDYVKVLRPERESRIVVT